MSVYVRDGQSILHVHIPKTGGDFVSNVLLDNGFERLPNTYTQAEELPNSTDPCARQHFHADWIRSRFEPNWSLSFAVVRHPFERFLSEYRYRVLSRGGRLGFLRRREPTWMWAARNLQRLRSDPFLHDNHLRPQVEFLLDDMDLVWKLEWGLEGLFERLRQLGVELHVDRPRRNVTRAEAGPSPIAPWLAKRLASVYCEDLEKLGYDTTGRVCHGARVGAEPA